MTRPHPVFEASPELVAAAVGVWGEELADQVSVPRVNLYTVKPGLAGEPHSVAEVFHQGENLIPAQSPHEGGGVEIEAAGRPYGHAAAGVGVGHVAAVPELDGDLGPFRVDGIREAPQFRDDLLPHPQLPVK